MAKDKSGKEELTQADNELVVGTVEKVEKELVVPKDAIVDVAVTVISLDADPYHQTGSEFQMGKKTAEEKARLGWVKIKKEEKAK